MIADRGLQALTLNALEPEWDARFGPRTYGFRPGRGCHDAIVAIHETVKGKNAKRLWVLDADLKAAFDYIDHDHLLSALGGVSRQGARRRMAESRSDRERLVHPTEDRGHNPPGGHSRGARRTRKAGLGKTALAHILTATAVNLFRLDAWWSGQPLAPTRTSHFVALDLAA
ncbi:reverse transcriptase domain-containing protein [Streptomyces kaempferi]